MIRLDVSMHGQQRGCAAHRVQQAITNRLDNLSVFVFLYGCETLTVVW